VRIGLLTEGGYPYATGEARLWCDRLVRGLGQHEFRLYALSRDREQERAGWVDLPAQVTQVRTAPLWTAEVDGTWYGRRARRRFAEHYGDLAAGLCTGPAGAGGPGAPSPAEADRFRSALYGLAELAREEGGMVAALRSEEAVRALERVCRAPGAPRAAREARVTDLLQVGAHLEQALRPLSLDWYEAGELGSVDLCHATAGGLAALPGLLARHFHGVPLVVTEYGVPLRAHYLGSSEAAPAVRALLAAFHGRLAAEVYRSANMLTPGNAHVRRWQERCGADRAKVRTVYPGMSAARFAESGQHGGAAGAGAGPGTLVWVGRIEPSKDLVTLLHAFAAVRLRAPGARLRIAGSAPDPEGAAYLLHCEELAGRLFPGDGAVEFVDMSGSEAPPLAEVYARGSVIVLSSVVEGFPVSVVEAMFSGRATVSTDVGAVVEVVGGTGLVVPPRDPQALAEACAALLNDPARRDRLGEAARARAMELFTVEQNVAAFHRIYLEVAGRCPARRIAEADAAEPRPFAVPAELRVAGAESVEVTR
jgi:glycosyltransferase involved in cell wall biosynthesis